jgi:hypothetical protein
MKGGPCMAGGGGGGNLSQGLKAKYSLWSALLFLVIASPFVYGITSRILGSWVAVRGCPTIAGLLLHSAVYFAGSFALMNLPKDFY